MDIISLFAAILEQDNTGLPQVDADATTLQTALNIAFAIIGAVTFLIIVIAGLRYIFAQGDPERITKSRNQILYAVIGLIITALAATIVNFVAGAV